MPASRTSVALTDTYRARAALLRARAAQLAATGWRNTLSGDDLDGTHERWVQFTAVGLTQIQRAGATLSGAYLTGFLTVELGRRAAATGASGDAPEIGASRDGRPLTEALAPTLFTVKRAIAEGRSLDDALALGANRAVRNAGEDVAAAVRGALDRGIAADERVVGWRRVTGGGCGACLAAATGAIQADDELLEVHDHCQCTKEPVVRGVRETVTRPTGREIFDAMPAAAQDALFAGTGGAEKADLIRSGEVPFEALIQHQHMAVIPDGITERPLESLRNH